MNNLTGKGNSLEELIVEHQPRLKAFIRKRVSSKEDAEDILQDVCINCLTYCKPPDYLHSLLRSFATVVFSIKVSLVEESVSSERATESELLSFINEILAFFRRHLLPFSAERVTLFTTGHSSSGGESSSTRKPPKKMRASTNNAKACQKLIGCHPKLPREADEKIIFQLILIF